MTPKMICEMNGREVAVAVSTVQNRALFNALELCYINRRLMRVRIWYGDKITGKAWNEENDVTGYISTSSGRTACLILCNNRSSSGGGAILEDCIVRIDLTNPKKTLYKHSNFHHDLAIDSDGVTLKTGEQVYATFPTPDKCQRLYKFMIGERYKK